MLSAPGDRLFLHLILDGITRFWGGGGFPEPSKNPLHPPPTHTCMLHSLPPQRTVGYRENQAPAFSAC